MEAIIRHSPITRNGPIYSIYDNSRFPVAVYRTYCAKVGKARSTVTHADPTHSGTRAAMPVMAKWISDSASALSPLHTSS